MGVIGETRLTPSDLVTGLRSIGLEAGHHVVVHSKLSSFGYVAGGADAVIDALEDVITLEGTIVMPTFSGELIFLLESLALKCGINGVNGTGRGVVFEGSLTRFWHDLREVSREAGIRLPYKNTGALSHRLGGEGKGILRMSGWSVEAEPELRPYCLIRLSRDAPPLLEEDVKPWLMPVWTGKIPDTFWRRPETIRSHQYSGSFTAWGRMAGSILGGHDDSPGQRIVDHPLYRMKEIEGKILLLGVDHRANSTIHVAQWAASSSGSKAPDPRDEFLEDFQLVDAPLEKRGGQRKGKIGKAEVRLADTKAIFEVVASLRDVGSDANSPRMDH